MRPTSTKSALAGALLIAAAAAGPADAAAGRDGGPTGKFSYSADPAVASVQRAAKAIVDRYEAGLNASDFDSIAPLFAPNAVAEWNDKATVIGPEAMREPYGALFKTVKFDTDFQFDAVDLYGDVAIVRTHHPVGQTELHLPGGTKTLDFNREVFVLHRVASDWKIVLYTFTTQPRQGEQ